MSNSKVRENKLWEWLKKVKPIYKRNLCLDRVENSTMKGMADVNGCLKPKKSFWIELKTEHRPVNPTTKVRPKFQPGQPEWLRKRAAVGENVFVLLQVGSGGQAKRYLIPGIHAAKMASGLTEDLLEDMAVLPPVAFAEEVIEAAANYTPI